MRRFKECIRAMLLALLLHNTSATRAGEVAVGVFAFQGERASTSDWGPLIQYLNQVLPEHRFHLVNQDAEGLRKEIADGRVDLVITNPGHYILLEAEYGLSRIATLETPGLPAGKSLGSAIVVRRDRNDLNSLTDLTDKRVAAVAEDAFGGYLLAARELLKSGVDPESDLKSVQFVGLPMVKVLEAVRTRQADAGFVRTCVLEQLVSEGALPAADLRVLSPRADIELPCATSTSLYPNWPIAVTRHTDSSMGKRILPALLSMSQAVHGMAWTIPEDYQPVHDLYRELRVGPYAYLRDTTLAAAIRRFWPWLLAMLAALTAWIVHTVRVEHLVHQRTAELRESLKARELAETHMHESQERMEHLSRLSVLGELSGTLAHELNQPLTAIGTYARTVLRRQANGNLSNTAIEEACSQIASEAERAGGIVMRIRNFARKRTSVRELVDLRVLVSEARHLLVGVMAHPPAIQIDDRVQGEAFVMADGHQIQQVLLNLIKNAIDAGKQLPESRQTIQVLIESEDHWIHLQVKDQGCGLEPTQLNHLFEPFFTTKQDGLGLGLPICKTIIEAHGGRLWATPNPDGEGMSFFFSLPHYDNST